MAGRMHSDAFKRAKLQYVTIFKQPIKLTAIALEVCASIEDFAECILHIGDLCADGNFATKFGLQIRRRREVIGMNMGLEYPLQFQIIALEYSQ